MVYFVTSFVIDSLFLSRSSGRNVADFMKLKGNEIVLLAPCYRGPVLTGIADKLDKGGINSSKNKEKIVYLK